VNAWEVASNGGLEALAPASLPVPAPGPGEVLVRMHAAALNFSDLLMIRGLYQVRPPLPFVPGQEIAGVVVGPDASPWTGRRVATKVLWGGFAEFALAREPMLIELPEPLSFEAGATLPVVWPTAWIALHDRARLASGELLLVHAGASGVGLAAIELGKEAGARIAATAGSPGKLALAREAGADAVFDYRDEDWPDAMRAFAPDGFDVVLDPVGGEVTDASIKLLAWGGRLLVVGFASGEIPSIRANRLLLRNAAAIGVYWSHERDTPLIGRAVAEVLRLNAAGRVRVAAQHVYPFAELPRAFAEFAGRQATGKSVILGP